MTNIWAQTFEEIRKPHFEMEDPYTKLEEGKAKRDYDEDGKIESGAKEHAGAVHNAIQRKKGGKPDGQDTSSVKEGYQRNPEKGEKEDRKYEPVRGEKRPMPPRGHKDREAFEKWYAANVREEALVEVEKKTSADKKVDVMKGGKNKVVINPAIREEVEEWVNELVEEGYDLSEFTWEDMAEIYEAVELDEAAPKIIGLQPASPRMVKGYPLGSSKVHDPSKMKDKKVKRVAEETELDEGTAGMPAAGDAERVSVTNPQIASAKRRAAQTQIAADMARIKLQRASTANESYDSIVEYLSQRNDAFENLEEGVFDPKKSKMRPASERTQRTMTDAQRTAAKKEAARVADIHSKGETVLQGLRPQGQRGKVKTTPAAKPAAPAANRTVRGRYDKLAIAANKILKSSQK